MLLTQETETIWNSMGLSAKVFSSASDFSGIFLRRSGFVSKWVFNKRCHAVKEHRYHIASVKLLLVYWEHIAFFCTYKVLFKKLQWRKSFSHVICNQIIFWFLSCNSLEVKGMRQWSATYFLEITPNPYSMEQWR